MPAVDNVFANDAAPRTASVPSVSMPVDVITVLTVLLPTLIRDVVKLTLAPTLTPVETFAAPVTLIPSKALILPDVDKVFENVTLPITVIVLLKSAGPDTSNTLSTMKAGPSTETDPAKVELPITASPFSTLNVVLAILLYQICV